MGSENPAPADGGRLWRQRRIGFPLQPAPDSFRMEIRSLVTQAGATRSRRIPWRMKWLPWRPSSSLSARSVEHGWQTAFKDHLIASCFFLLPPPSTHPPIHPSTHPPIHPPPPPSAPGGCCLAAIVESSWHLYKELLSYRVGDARDAGDAGDAGGCWRVRSCPGGLI